MAAAAPPPAGGPRRRGARSRRQGLWARWHRRAERTWAAAQRRFPVITELTARLLSVNVLDAATRLAAQLFLTAVPLVFVAAALMPGSVRDQLVTSTRDLFGLTGASAEQLREVYGAGAGGSHEGLRGTTGAIGAVIVLLSATASSRAMARVCERAWLLPRAGARVAVWRWFVWLVAWGAVLVLQGPLRKGFGLGPLLGVPLLFLADVAVWWWTQRLLLSARVPWLRLLPGALLTSAAMTALSVTARFYMPLALNRSIATYGSLGSVFTLLSWLIACCAVITFTLTAGAVLATEPPLAPLLDRERFAPDT
ncbi:YhjD/YihY/BrkB family envelope integrity protein [Streptomyces sp. V4-01]|uniref:YhjD/YihY/BrkB family envelope integrity protein n=1 Tax=Actinacidiphila polyblastidii TaxID=3110430 RepID=A0ABU7PGC8_9ACTN|nr:YhjD/YihY/BrkB family envelope integrity protein [Streptomyces sp. V4-01]